MSDERPSKSARKRQAQTVRSLADRLVALAPDELERVVPDADIAEAVREAQGMPSHGAGRRQRQYIAKLLRHADTGAILAALHEADATPAAERRRFHAAERLRDLLLSGADPGDTLAAAGLPPAPDVDAALERWRGARGDGERKRAARTLFRTLHGLLADRGDGPAPG